MFMLNIVVSDSNLVFGRWGSVDCVIKGIKYIYLTLERRKRLDSAGLFIWRGSLDCVNDQPKPVNGKHCFILLFMLFSR